MGFLEPSTAISAGKASVYLFQGRNDEALTEWRVAFENGWYGTPTGASQDFLFIEAPVPFPVDRCIVDETSVIFVMPHADCVTQFMGQDMFDNLVISIFDTIDGTWI